MVSKVAITVTYVLTVAPGSFQSQPEASMLLTCFLVRAECRKRQWLAVDSVFRPSSRQYQVCVRTFSNEASMNGNTWLHSCSRGIDTARPLNETLGESLAWTYWHNYSCNAGSWTVSTVNDSLNDTPGGVCTQLRMHISDIAASSLAWCAFAYGPRTLVSRRKLVCIVCICTVEVCCCRSFFSYFHFSRRLHSIHHLHRHHFLRRMTQRFLNEFQGHWNVVRLSPAFDPSSMVTLVVSRPLVV